MTELTQKYMDRLALLARMEADQCKGNLRRQLRAVCDGDSGPGKRLEAQSRLAWHLRNASRIGLCREEEFEEAVRNGFLRSVDLAARILNRRHGEDYYA
ncbi:MAG: hypothetical protein IT210_21000 [Armatimonadetes bacterium]|nr:hypothetical protein [Armatimonadota bacterium]